MSDEKTEQPSAKRLRDARQKGQVAKSQDIPSAFTTIAVALYLLSMGSSIYNDLLEMSEIPFQVMNRPFAEALPLAFFSVTSYMVLLTLPFVGIVILTSLIANLGQVGVLFAPEGAMPKLSNLSPSQWFKKVFSVKNVVELLKNFIKLFAIGYVVYLVFESIFPLLFKLPSSTIESVLSVIGVAIGDMLIQSAAVFCLIAAADYVYQRFQFTKQNMMTKDEVKREYKESEGDPQVKGQRKQLHQEMLSQNTLGNTRKAKVLITNPTHFAIAIDYDKDKTPLPKILAKGQDALAQRMIEVAKQEGIPVMRNVPLARALFETGTENAYIPKDLIGPVAEVLRFIQDL